MSLGFEDIYQDSKHDIAANLHKYVAALTFVARHTIGCNVVSGLLISTVLHAGMQIRVSVEGELYGMMMVQSRAKHPKSTPCISAVQIMLV